MPRKLRVRQNPVASFFGGIMALIFVGIGIAIVIPSAGAFGYIWTFAALIAAITSLYNAFSSRGIASEIIEADDDDEPREAETLDVATRLRRLEDLKSQDLITPAEYAQQRAEILRSL